MAGNFKTGTEVGANTVLFNSNVELVHQSFDYFETSINATEIKIFADTTTDGGDQFGFSVAVGNGKVVAGARYDTDNGTNSGSAYIFDLAGNELVRMLASDGAASDQFGYSVAVGSGRIVVGAYGDDSLRGSAYIFDLDGTQLAKITASDGVANDYFGQSVAVGYGRIVVGAWGDDDNGSASGSAYIFDLDGTQLAKITASDAAASDDFGYSVAVGNGKIVVGATGAGGSGAAYIFDLDGTELSKITASDGAGFDDFGNSVAVGSGRIVVGARYDDDDGNGSGSAYIFDLDGKQLAKITASDAAASDNFGVSVAVGSGRIVVGADFDDDNGSASGSAYIFDLDGNQLEKITANNGGSASDRFGRSVAVGNGRIVVGAYLDSGGFGRSDAGSAYIYKLPETYDVLIEKKLGY